MIKKLTLTEEHIKLIRMIDFEDDDVNDKLTIDKINPYVLSGRLEDLALVLGYSDKAIKGTENDPEGAAFPDDIEEHILSIHHYIVDNLYYIESLIHQMIFEGKITPGTYKCVDTELIWEKE